MLAAPDDILTAVLTDNKAAGLPAHDVSPAQGKSRPGTVIIVNNVVRGGAVMDEAGADPNMLSVRAFLQMMADEQGLNATALQTVGEKGGTVLPLRS